MSEIECIDALLPQLSIEQKASFLVGMGINVPGAFSVQQAEKVPGAAGSTYPIPELNIPSMTLSDGPAGVRIEPQREGSERSYYCTALMSVHCVSCICAALKLQCKTLNRGQS